jgi:hypothetical protein
MPAPGWEFAVGSHVLKLQHLQNKFLHDNRNLSRRTPTRDLHVAFKIPYIYDSVTAASRQKSYKLMKM